MEHITMVGGYCVGEHAPDQQIPTYGESATFASWAEFVARLWLETPEDFRGDATDPDEFARGCMLSENGVFVVTHEPDGRVRVENVG